ncbi:MAG: deoxyhypusine synthase family protein [Desulfobacterales bacterium]|nr:deoxyhypusine synthase family protein [Desulfobacterales bacterium]
MSELKTLSLSAFDRTKLNLKSLSTRKHDFFISSIVELNEYQGGKQFLKNNPVIHQIATDMIIARQKKSSIMLMIGAHVIRSGVQRYLIDLLERGYISCIATNGAGMIHDFELSMIGATTESVAYYIKDGQFGLWKETGLLNDIIHHAYQQNSMAFMGETIGRAIYESNFPFKDISLLNACYRLGIPITVHVGIGYDIIHEHPNCDGAATGALSYNDFLLFTKMIENLENGVVMNFGSAVMAPEVFLKALSMARNVSHAQGKFIHHITTLVCDIRDISFEHQSEPSKDQEQYYFRPLKTMLVRTIADGGNGYYIKGKHLETIPALWEAINEIETQKTI